MPKYLEMRQAEMRNRYAKSSNRNLGKTKAKGKPTTARQPMSRTTEPTRMRTTTSTAQPKGSGLRLELDLQYQVCLESSIVQERTYSEYYLPLTMKVALQSKDILMPELRQFPIGWPFEDKVLVRIAPTFREDVRSFHRGVGSNICGI